MIRLVLDEPMNINVINVDWNHPATRFEFPRLKRPNSSNRLHRSPRAILGVHDRLPRDLATMALLLLLHYPSNVNAIINATDANNITISTTSIISITILIPMPCILRSMSSQLGLLNRPPGPGDFGLHRTWSDSSIIIDLHYHYSSSRPPPRPLSLCLDELVS